MNGLETEKQPLIDVLIPVTKNEAPCLPDTLESVRRDIEDIGQHCGIIVIANCCAGVTDEVAKVVFNEPQFQTDLITTQVINCETPGKMFAVNDGIEQSTAENLVLIDGDLVLDRGSLRWTLDALQTLGKKVVSMHHAPIEGALPDDCDLATVIRMNAHRRHVFPEKYWLHGAYLGWKADLKIDGKPMRFPAGKRVHEDNWLTAVISKEYGKEAMLVTKNYMARFIPPSTWEDYYNQQWRYQFAHEDLANEFPSLASYIPAIREWTNAKYPPEWIDMQWREICIKDGIDFDGVIDFYKEVLAKVRAGKEQARDLLDENGVWKQQVTTKLNSKNGS